MGTVQATLLNPQHTVVRMFFVPYDFRDMPGKFCKQNIRTILFNAASYVYFSDVSNIYPTARAGD